MSAASLFFRIVYNTIYYLLHLVLLAFLVVTPADLINQSRLNGQDWNIIVIILCVAVTIGAVLFVYVTRLYINRSVLSSIPKPYIPIEKGDVPRKVRQVIVEELSKSAAIAYEARPRLCFDATPAVHQDQGQGGHAAHDEGRPTEKATEKASARVPISKHAAPVWGEISHPGWSSPTSQDTPNLHYSSVISELPNLIEAKALTLAPADPELGDEAGMLDAEAVGLLQRAENMGLREYVAHLTQLGVLEPLSAGNEFIAIYEHARYSTETISHERFRHLMHLVAEILRNMQPLDPARLGRESDDGFSDDDSQSDGGHVDDNAPRGDTNPSTPRSHASCGGRLPTRSSKLRRLSSSTASSAPERPAATVRHSSAHAWPYRTAPTSPKSRHPGLSRAASANTFAQTRQPYLASSASSTSLRSASEASVIRLATRDDDTDLPYVLHRTPTL